MISQPGLCKILPIVAPQLVLGCRLLLVAFHGNGLKPLVVFIGDIPPGASNQKEKNPFISERVDTTIIIFYQPFDFGLSACFVFTYSS